MKTALTIAGSDPTGGAGLQADLKVFHTLGVHGLSVPSALTAQSTGGVELVEAVEGGLFRRQLDVLLSDIRPDALKTGMLYTVRSVGAVAGAVRGYSLENLVVDPVAVSSSGTSLAGEGVLDAVKDLLFPLSRVITPNIYEAALLTGIDTEAVAMEEVAVALRGLGSEVVIVTGGHLERLAVDLYYDGEDFHRLEGAKAEGGYHGTGCVFSAAVAALLALGKNPLEAARGAKELIRAAIGRAYHPGKGMGLLNI